MNKEKVLERILNEKAVAVVRIKDEEKLMNSVEALLRGGISIIEITLSVPNALEMIEKLNKTYDDKLLVGVGSVTNKGVALEAVSAGAKYIVSPILKEEIIQAAKEKEVPVMPGAFTPTEIQTAVDMGADIVKVFPADIVGMKFFKAVLAPMPDLKLMPTGGVSLDNGGDWLRSGACAIGIGSSLLDKSAIENERYEVLTENAKRVINSINKFAKDNYEV